MLGSYSSVKLSFRCHLLWEACQSLSLQIIYVRVLTTIHGNHLSICLACPRLDFEPLKVLVLASRTLVHLPAAQCLAPGGTQRTGVNQHSTGSPTSLPALKRQAARFGVRRTVSNLSCSRLTLCVPHLRHRDACDRRLETVRPGRTPLALLRLQCLSRSWGKSITEPVPTSPLTSFLAAAALGLFLHSTPAPKRPPLSQLAKVRSQPASQPAAPCAAHTPPRGRTLTPRMSPHLERKGSSHLHPPRPPPPIRAQPAPGTARRRGRPALRARGVHLGCAYLGGAPLLPHAHLVAGGIPLPLHAVRLAQHLVASSLGSRVRLHPQQVHSVYSTEPERAISSASKLRPSSRALGRAAS